MWTWFRSAITASRPKPRVEPLRWAWTWTHWTGTCSANVEGVGNETTAYEAAPSVPLAPSQRRRPSAPAPRAAGAQRRRMRPRPA